MSGVQFPQFSEREFVHRAPAVGGALKGRIVDGNETRVAGEVQVGLDKRGAQLNGSLERRERVLRCTA